MMDQQIKNILGMALIGVLMVIGVSAIVLTRVVYKSTDPASSRTFSVNGEGEAFAVPDIAEFSFGVISQGGVNLDALQEDNVKKTNNIIAYLKEQGVKDEDIKTSGYNVNPQYQYFECRTGVCPPPKITGYEINQQVQVKVRDLTKAGSFLSGVVAKGANNVSGLNFTIEDPMAIQNEARKEAIERAQSQAKEVAKAGGFRLGKLIAIQENGGGSPVPYMAYGQGGTADMAVSSVENKAIELSVAPGSNEVVINITLVYEIK